MKKSFLISSIVCLAIIVTSCSNLFENKDQQNDENTTTTTVSVTTTTLASAETDTTLAAYRRIELSDFSALGGDYSLPASTDLADPYIFNETLYLGFMYLDEMMEKVSDGEAYITPKAIEASIRFHMKDEGFTIDALSSSTDDQYLDVTVNHLDLVAEGRLNNFTKFLLAMNDTYSPLEDELAASSYTGASLFYQGESKDKKTKMLMSLYVELDIDIDDLTSSGTVSGKLSASFGTNHLYSYDSNSYVTTDLGRFPCVIQLELRPFKDVSVRNIQEAIELLSDADESDDPQALWNRFCDLVWGNHNEDYYLEARVLVGDSAGNEIIGERIYLADMDLMNVF